MTEAIYDQNGEFLARVYDEYVAKGLSRGEIVRHEDGWLVAVPQEMRTLSPEEKRRLVLARERGKR